MGLAKTKVSLMLNHLTKSKEFGRKRGVNKKVIVTIPCLLLGGTELQTSRLVKALSQNGYNVQVICFFEHCSDGLKIIKEAGADVALLGLDRKHGLLKLFRKLICHFKENKPYIVHIQYMSPGFIPVLAARLARVPTVFATVHQPGRTYGWKAKLLLRAASSLCDQFFCISKAVEKSWFGSSQLFNPDTVRKRGHCTIYNAVDVHSISKAAEKARKEGLRRRLGLTEYKVIGCVGRLRREKGQQWLISAMSEVLEHYPNVRLLLIGDGPDRRALEEQARSLGVMESIVWLGEVPPDDVAQYYGAMDVLVVPSEFEGFGLVAAEGMAAGLPVIASKVDGLCEVVSHEYTGYLVHSGKVDELLFLILSLLFTPEKRMLQLRNAAYAKAQEFSYELYESNIIKAYKLSY